MPCRISSKTIPLPIYPMITRTQHWARMNSSLMITPISPQSTISSNKKVYWDSGYCDYPRLASQSAKVPDANRDIGKRSKNINPDTTHQNHMGKDINPDTTHQNPSRFQFTLLDFAILFAFRYEICLSSYM